MWTKLQAELHHCGTQQTTDENQQWSPSNHNAYWDFRGVCDCFLVVVWTVGGWFEFRQGEIFRAVQTVPEVHAASCTTGTGHFPGL
jgi:hypothetical protein